MVRTPPAASGVVVGTEFEGGAVQQTVRPPPGVIEEPDFHRLLDDASEFVLRDKQNPGECLQGHSRYVGGGQIADRNEWSFSVEESVSVGPI